MFGSKVSAVLPSCVAVVLCTWLPDTPVILPAKSPTSPVHFLALLTCLAAHAAGAADIHLGPLFVQAGVLLLHDRAAHMALCVTSSTCNPSPAPLLCSGYFLAQVSLQPQMHDSELRLIVCLVLSWMALVGVKAEAPQNSQGRKVSEPGILACGWLAVTAPQTSPSLCHRHQCVWQASCCGIACVRIQDVF